MKSSLENAVSETLGMERKAAVARPGGDLPAPVTQSSANQDSEIKTPLRSRSACTGSAPGACVSPSVCTSV
ncbi:hypothetical protein GN956_G23412 [Arapaima gigas]